MRFTHVVTTALLALVCLTGTVVGADITIDASTTYQTIEGMGAYGAMNPYKIKVGPFYEDVDLDEMGLYDTFANDLSMLRYDLLHSFQQEQDGPYTPEDFSNFRKVADRGLTRFIISIWSPPTWMKDSREVSGGSLLPDMADDLADYCIAFCEEFRSQVGVYPYAMSMQNEPEWDQPYKSCSYTPTEYLDAFKVWAPRLKAAGLGGIKTFGPEHVKTYDRTYRYANPIFTDPDAKPHLDVLATHGYADDAITPGSQTAADWQHMFDLANDNGKVLWMTETGNDTGYVGAMKAARRIMGALKYGQISAWTWWTLMSGGSPTQHNLIADGGPQPKYYTSVNFFRYIRPGAIQLQSTSTDDQVGVVAFNNPTNQQYSIVIVNDASVTKSISLSGAGIPATLKVCQTTEGSGMVMLADQQSSASFTVPGESVTSLFTPASTAVSPPRRTPRETEAVRPLFDKTPVQVFSLDGRALDRRTTAGAHAAGVYATRSAAGTHGMIVGDRR